MELQVFSVFDSAANAYTQPFFERSLGTAIRAFQDACQTEGHQFWKHAADYTLFHIGVWNEDTGKVTMLDAHVPLGNGLEYRSPELEIQN